MGGNYNIVFWQQLWRYATVGALNTVVGLSAITFMIFAGFDPFTANATGFAAGLSTSFFFNRRFTFRSHAGWRAVMPFFVSFAICYGINLLTLYYTASLSRMHLLLPQLCAVLAYNVSFFILMKTWVFSGRNG